MAVYAAHLTRTLQGTPSVFQIAAQEALAATLKPALRRVVEYISEIYPNKCGWCNGWYDEVYLAADCILQYYYLKYYAASFSECFYGLLRVPLFTTSEFSHGTRLPDKLEKGSLFLLVLIPYLKDKLEKLIDRWKDELESGCLGKSKSDQARRAAVKVYSIIYAVTELSKLAVLARYLCGQGRSPTLPLYLLGLTLTDVPAEAEDFNWKDVFSSLRNGQFNGEAVAKMSMRALGAGAQYALFGVQLLRWWAAQGPALAVLPTPPPPQKREGEHRWRNVCPLCRQRWRAPAVLPTSGYVYCYICISRALRRDGTCPATGLPAAEPDLRRVYLPG